MDKFLCVFHRNKIVQILYIIFFCKTNLCVGYIDTQVESQNEKEKGTPGPESSAGICLLGSVIVWPASLSEVQVLSPIQMYTFLTSFPQRVYFSSQA